MEILNALLEITIYSGVIFAVVMLFKKLLRDRISPALHLGIWLILIIRLVMPVTFESAVHFITMPQEAIQEQAPAAPAVTGNPTGQQSGNGVAPLVTQEVQANPNPQLQQNAHTPTTAASSRKTITIDPITILLSVWVTGMAVMSVLSVRGYACLLRRMKRNAVKPPIELLELLHECKREMGMKGHTRMTVQYNLHSPALLFPSTIVIPIETLSMERSQIKLALLHELTHYKRKDQLSAMLLLVLKTVYWFNPIVWIAESKIRDDIETTCDSMVVRCLNIDEKRYYAHTLLSMYRRDSAPQMVLGMALGGTRRNAEQRIRGIYMKRKSKFSIKCIAVLLAGVIGVCCFTTACQPTPEKAVVVNKNDGKLEAAIHEADNQAAESETGQTENGLYDKLGAPATWQEQQMSSDGIFDIQVDAPVTLPDVSGVPVATAQRRVFTQDEVNKAGEILFGKDAVYTEQVYYTKERIEDSIVAEQQFMEEMKAEGDDVMVEKAQNAIDSLQSMYDEAPSESELQQKDLTLGEREGFINVDEISSGVSVTTNYDGKTYLFDVYNGLQDPYVSIGASVESGIGGGVGFPMIDEPYGVSLTKEQAAQQGAAIAAQLTDELQLSHVGVAVAGGYTLDGQEMEQRWGWACVFTRTINGCPATYTVNDVGSDMESTLKAPISYEQMVIVLDDQGVMGFSWVNPLEVTGIENDNVELLPFEQIREIAMGQIESKYLEYEADTRNNPIVHVTGAQLGLMRVDKQDSDEYYYLPVWDIYSELTHPGNEPLQESDIVDDQGNLLGGMTSGYAPETWNSVTINAIDGSIINRYTGN